MAASAQKPAGGVYLYPEMWEFYFRNYLAAQCTGAMLVLVVIAELAQEHRLSNGSTTIAGDRLGTESRITQGLREDKRSRWEG